MFSHYITHVAMHYREDHSSPIDFSNFSHILHVKSPTLPRYTWVVGFVSLEQTSSLKMPFVEE
jgi:hypothetical protein